MVNGKEWRWEVFGGFGLLGNLKKGLEVSFVMFVLDHLIVWKLKNF